MLLLSDFKLEHDYSKCDEVYSDKDLYTIDGKSIVLQKKIKHLEKEARKRDVILEKVSTTVFQTTMGNNNMVDRPILATTAKRKKSKRTDRPKEKKRRKKINHQKEEEEYIPWKIMNKRMGVDDDEMEYLVQWKHYPNKRDWTWEPENAPVFQVNAL